MHFHLFNLLNCSNSKQNHHQLSAFLRQHPSNNLSVSVPFALMAFISVIFVPAPLVPTSFIPVFLALVATVTRFIFRRFHEVHRPTTGIVSVAMPVPFSRVTRWDMQIERGDVHCRRMPPDYHRLRIKNRRWRGAAKLNLTIDARADFASNAKVYDRRSRIGNQAGKGHGCKRSCFDNFHDIPFAVRVH